MKKKWRRSWQKASREKKKKKRRRRGRRRKMRQVGNAASRVRGGKEGEEEELPLQPLPRLREVRGFPESSAG